VDVLCTKQDDLDEKAKSLPKMQSLYRISSVIIIWVGPGSAESSPVLAIRSFLDQNISHDNPTIMTESAIPGVEAVAEDGLFTFSHGSLDYIIQALPAIVEILQATC
jgi:hypothetical protein